MTSLKSELVKCFGKPTEKGAYSCLGQTLSTYYLYRRQYAPLLKMNKNTSHWYLRRITPIAGIVGCLTVVYGLLESATHYTRSGSYSPKNHFISELGLPHASSMAYVFDHSLMLAGLLLLLFTVGLQSFFKESRVVRYATYTGMIATLSFSSVGYFTADHWLWHKFSSILFFTGVLVSMALFSYEMWRHRESGLYHPVLVMIVSVMTVLYLLVLCWPKSTFTEYVYHSPQFVRPEVWPLSIMEWVYCLLICVWIVTISVRLGLLLRSASDESSFTNYA